MQILHLIILSMAMMISNFSATAESLVQKDKQTALSDNLNKPKLLFIAGSTRKESLNKKLAYNVFKVAENLGADATLIDLRDFPMPIYDGDLESNQGLPQKTIELKKIFAEHDGILIASPEYNSSITPLLKNTLDWISRSHEVGEVPNSVYKGKVIALCSASPSNLGGQRGLIPLQMMLGNIGTIVLPQKVSISEAHNKFNDQGLLIDEKNIQEVKKLAEELIRVTAALKK